ncbi:hypothetical protein [Parabacteroides pacaensis]|uniref:hypothetical protein n=1 Tax=Parabacteroides pacaensis TaxID=2086575 RepID=UPI00131ADA95|nr:hypothetical protein [Parabacteroides pacaensis]
MKHKLDNYAWAQAKTDLGATGCTGAIEVPVVASVCYATVMLNYADDIRQADGAYTDCKKNK